MQLLSLTLYINFILTIMATATSSPEALLDRIYTNAAHDSIDLAILPFHQEALDSITALSSSAQNIPSYDFTQATKIDTHTHPIPSWFHALEPQAAGRATPEWNATSHLFFMASHGIKRSVLSVSTPQANAFLTERDEALRKQKTIALARLLNEFVAELCRVYPERFSWLAVTPLPYVTAAVTEARYALDELGAVGVGVLTNHEGVYPGDEAFDELWGYLQGRAKDGREVVFIHPTEPVIKLDDGRIVNSRPCKSLCYRCGGGEADEMWIAPLRSGLGEFYFETARAISSVTAGRTMVKFPDLHWRVSHGAGAFPDISERFLLGFPDVSDEARKAYKERFWYDCAGPVFPNQIKGLTEGMKVPVSQLVFGTVRVK
jgi:hypothetical protein